LPLSIVDPEREHRLFFIGDQWKWHIEQAKWRCS